MIQIKSSKISRKLSLPFLESSACTDPPETLGWSQQTTRTKPCEEGRQTLKNPKWSLKSRRTQQVSSQTT